jgi:hypothetical protein
MLCHGAPGGQEKLRARCGRRREALQLFFEAHQIDEQRPHIPEECAAVVPGHCPPVVQERMRLV